MTNNERYSRQTLLPMIGDEGQRKVAAARVLVVGLGGLGAPVASYLAGAGVGTLGLCDLDTVSLSNLQRQILYTAEEVGMPKAEQALWRLEAQNEDVEFRLHPDGLTPENADTTVGDYDLVMDCTDNFATRYLIDDACAAAGIPWVHAAIGEVTGQLSVFNFGERPRRFADLFPDRDALIAMPPRMLGAIGPVAGVVGSLQALEAMKVIVGFGSPLTGRLLTLDLLTYGTQIIEF